MRTLKTMLIAGLMSLAAATGCVRYEYDIVEPPNLAQQINKKDDTVFRTDAAEYRLRNYDNRLVMRVYNTGDQPMRLAGDRSVVVDPNGESHPLISQTIEPGSYIKLIFPPPLPTLERRPGPSIHFGVGYRYGRYHRRNSFGRYAYGDPFFYDDVAPRYYRVYDDANPIYWDWRGEGEIRLKLVFESEEKTVEDRFVIARKKG